MYPQPAILLGVLALAGEVLSVSLAGGENARQHHARQSRMHRRRGLPGNDSDNNPCKREQDSSSSKGTTSFRITDASTGNVTVIPATSYIRQGQGENAYSESRKPLNNGESSSDVLSDERTSLASEASAEDESSSWEASSSSSTSSSAAPATSSATSSGGSGGGMSVVTSWSGDDVSWHASIASDPNTNLHLLLLTVPILGFLHVQRSYAWRCQLRFPVRC